MPSRPRNGHQQHHPQEPRHRRPTPRPLPARSTAPPGGPRSARPPGTAADPRPAPRRWHNAAPGSFSRHFRQIVSRSRGTSACKRRSGTGSSWTICSSVSCSDVPLNGGRPVRHS